MKRSLNVNDCPKGSLQTLNQLQLRPEKVYHRKLKDSLKTSSAIFIPQIGIVQKENANHSLSSPYKSSQGRPMTQMRTLQNNRRRFLKVSMNKTQDKMFQNYTSSQPHFDPILNERNTNTQLNITLSHFRPSDTSNTQTPPIQFNTILLSNKRKELNLSNQDEQESNRNLYTDQDSHRQKNSYRKKPHTQHGVRPKKNRILVNKQNQQFSQRQEEEEEQRTETNMTQVYQAKTCSDLVYEHKQEGSSMLQQQRSSQATRPAELISKRIIQDADEINLMSSHSEHFINKQHLQVQQKDQMSKYEDMFSQRKPAKSRAQKISLKWKNREKQDQQKMNRTSTMNQSQESFKQQYQKTMSNISQYYQSTQEIKQQDKATQNSLLHQKLVLAAKGKGHGNQDSLKQMQTLLSDNQKKNNSILLMKKNRSERAKTGIKARKRFQQLTVSKEDMNFSSAREEKDPYKTLKLLSQVKPSTRNDLNPSTYSPSQRLNSTFSLNNGQEVLAASQIINKEADPNSKLQKRVKHFENQMETIKYQGYLDKCHHLNKLKDQLRKHKDHLSHKVKQELIRQIVFFQRETEEVENQLY